MNEEIKQAGTSQQEPSTETKLLAKSDEDTMPTNTIQQEPATEIGLLAKNDEANSIIYIVGFLAFLILFALLALIKKKLKKPMKKVSFESFKKNVVIDIPSVGAKRAKQEDTFVNISLDIPDDIDVDVDIDINIQTDSPKSVTVEVIPQEPAKPKAFKTDDLYSNEDLSLLSADALDFVEDRIAELEISADFTDRELDKWGLSVIDFLYELRLSTASNFITKSACEILSCPLKTELAERAFQLIDEEKWNPALQRAIRVVESDEIEIDTIKEVLSFGLIKDGKILQKQEVILLRKISKN